MSNNKHKILFFAEAVTLAHVARPVALLDSLNSEKYHIDFACDNRYQKLFPALKVDHHDLYTIPSEKFLQALTKGSPVYDSNTLKRYVQNDLEIIESVAPDVIVGDFRLSLAVSARLAKIPYITVSNIYWSPFVKISYPIPVHPMVNMVGVGLAQILFNLSRPIIFAYHCLPMNKVRKYYGLPSLGYDIRKLYTEADHTLYADIPELFEATKLPANHHFIGPIIWSPEIKQPKWWDKISNNKPIIYVSLGSSGAIDLLPVVFKALENCPAQVMVATAGRRDFKQESQNVFLTDFLSGHDACSIADLVICNGGSPSTQQALFHGVPIIGIVSNMDQHLNMSALEKIGAALKLRADTVDVNSLRDAVNKILSLESYVEKAKDLKDKMAMSQKTSPFEKIISELIS